MDLRESIAEVLAGASGVLKQDVSDMLEVPSDTAMGDFALPCFKLSKIMRKAPQQIAQDLRDRIDKPGFVSRIENVGGYLNFYIDRAFMARLAIENVLEKGGRYGSSDEGRGRTICIDYSSVNIAKPLHIGHLSTTVIGHSLYNIFNFLGYACVGINHLGDWGTQFGKLIVAYKKWGDRAGVEQGGVEELNKLYVRFHEEVEKHPALDDDARAWFKKIEDGDPEAMELFNWFKEITLKDVAKIYELLEIKFDSYAGESFYNDKMQPVIDELDQKGLLVEDQGARVVLLEDMPPCLILKSDGATLYATRDIAAAFYRKKTYDFDKCLYVTAYEQDLHFRQWFKVIERMGYDWAADLVHVNYGRVSMEEGSMSTRMGRIIRLDEVLNRTLEKARDIVEEKSPQLLNKEEIARMVGVGAAVFTALKNNRIKDIVFSWDNALNFDGETAPYVQYTHARCSSVLERAGLPEGVLPDYAALKNEEARAVVSLLASFPETVENAAKRYEPFLITRHIINLAKAYNKYYFDHRILTDEDASLVKARLNLTEAARQVIRIGLSLLGIKAPEKM